VVRSVAPYNFQTVHDAVAGVRAGGRLWIGRAHPGLRDGDGGPGAAGAVRIKKFYGNSENAVKSQIWIAVSVYVLVAIVKKRLDVYASLYTLLQVLSVTLFKKMPLQEAIPSSDHTIPNAMPYNQLNLFTY
jgi:hypothetical protein